MKKVLVVSYYWPPAGGPGVQRWLKFVTYLPDFGIEPIVYLPKNPNYPLVDNSLEAELPGNLKIYRQKIKEPLQWGQSIFGKDVRRISSGLIKEQRPSWKERVLLWIRGNFFIPDARVWWVKPSIKRISRIISKEDIDTVITTGPPHSLHLIGMGLKEKTGIKWVADFRDPWTTIGYHSQLRLGPAARRKHRELESKVLNMADKVLVTSRHTKKEFKSITNKPVAVITNGYETKDFTKVDTTLDKQFTLSHIGSLLSGRNPEALWIALKQLVTSDKEFNRAFSLRLVGAVSQEVLQNIEAHGLAGHLEHRAYLPHDEAVKLQQQSQLLLLIEINRPETRGILPGKLFEYLAARRPVLAIGPDRWEAGDIIRDTCAGEVFGYDDPVAIKKALQAWFKRYRSGTLELESKGIEKYSRKELTRNLAKELEWE